MIESPLELLGVRALQIGIFPPFRNGLELLPDRARAWRQDGYANEFRGKALIPTVVGRSRELPAGFWAWLSERLANTGVMHVEGEPRLRASDMPTWFIEVVTATMTKRVKAYGADLGGGSEGDEIPRDLYLVHQAVFVLTVARSRIAWEERLEMQPVTPAVEDMADLLAGS